MIKLTDRTNGYHRAAAIYELHTATQLHERAECTLAIATRQRGLAEMALFEGRDGPLWARLRDFEEDLRAKAMDLAVKRVAAVRRALLCSEALAADIAALETSGDGEEAPRVEIHHRVEATALVFGRD
jgi:hypothetical protein